MAKTNISHQKPNSANSRSHACNSSKRQQKTNLQVIRLEDGTKRRITAREKRTLLKNEKIAT